MPAETTNSRSPLSRTEIARHLQLVSRTFALTIPLMGQQLELEVGLGYLICRIADTIEDDPIAAAADRSRWLKDFSRCSQSGFADPEEIKRLQSEALRLTRAGAKPAEYALLEDMDRVIAAALQLPAAIQHIFARGVAILSEGMAAHVEQDLVLNTPEDVDAYCYSVAGVVGEFLAELFAAHADSADRRGLLTLAVSFGEGLQLTNILKDRSEDAQRGVSFLPRRAELQGRELVLEYVAVTRGHLDNALAFTRLLPASGLKGVRRFCLLNILMAVMTLRRIAANPLGEGSELKISRRMVKTLVILSFAASGSNLLTGALYYSLARSLPCRSQDCVQLRGRVSKWPL